MEYQNIDAQAVAVILGATPAYVIRMSETGRIPRPITTGDPLLWSRTEMLEWLAHGCPPLSDR